jgi:hypothetical protein
MGCAALNGLRRQPQQPWLQSLAAAVHPTLLQTGYFA